MSLLTFKGGVHPNDGKALAKDKAIVQVQPKGDLVYPMSQHIGAPAVPIVAKGDHVLRGQMIAEAGGFVRNPECNRRCRNCRYGWSWISNKGKIISKRTG